jgi:hypothetical protein
MRSIARVTTVVLAPSLQQLLGVNYARWMSVHQVVVRLSLGKRVPLGRLQESM